MKAENKKLQDEIDFLSVRVLSNGDIKKTKSTLSNVNTEYILKQDKLYEVQFDVVLYDQVEDVELDEMWSFVNSKGNQRWLWLALNHNTGDRLKIALFGIP